MKPRDLPWTSTEKAIFADALADGDSIPVAARRAGRRTEEGERQFRRMEADLGETPSHYRPFGNQNSAGARGHQIRGRRYEPCPRWTAERTERLKAALKQDLTFEQIGARLGISRNAVAGKASRLRSSV